MSRLYCTVYGVRRCGFTKNTPPPPKGRNPAAAKSIFGAGGFEGNGLGVPVVVNGSLMKPVGKVQFPGTLQSLNTGLVKPKNGACPLNCRLSSPLSTS